MKTYEQPKVRVRLRERDVITASVAFDEELGDYHTVDPFSNSNWGGNDQ